MSSGLKQQEARCWDRMNNLILIFTSTYNGKVYSICPNTVFYFLWMQWLLSNVSLWLALCMIWAHCLLFCTDNIFEVGDFARIGRFFCECSLEKKGLCLHFGEKCEIRLHEIQKYVLAILYFAWRWMKLNLSSGTLASAGYGNTMWTNHILRCSIVTLGIVVIMEICEILSLISLSYILENIYPLSLY